MLKLGVLVSGSGTNLQAILDAIARKQLDAEIRTVISNKPDAYALERARSSGVPVQCISNKDFPSREVFDAALVEALRAADVDWVVLAGFMRLLTKTFLESFPMRIVNIHPSLLPAFPGVDAQRQAFEYGVKITGCTVHLVDEGTDTGPIVAQRAVSVLEDENAEKLRERILAVEHELLVEALGFIANGRLRVVSAGGGRTKVRIDTA